MTQSITIDSNFPGGNILVDRIEEHATGGAELYVHQDLRDTEGDWFYWYFRVKGAAGRMLRISFTGSDVIGTRGPGVCLDGGRTWNWLGRDSVEGQCFSYMVPAGAEEVRFSMGMPYVQANLTAFLHQNPSSSAVEQKVLCRSRHGQPVEILSAGRLDDHARFCLLLTSRHHSCEMMATYTLEGMLQSTLAQDDLGAWLREHVKIFAVPFMDKDGVEGGDQGKNRRPHDHNRDYGQDCVYPEVRALRQLVPQWSAERPLIALDLHCPWIRGENNEWIYFVGTEDPQNWTKQNQLGAILERTQQAGLNYRCANNLPYGKAWNVMDGNLKDNTRWAVEQPNILLASTLEIPYATANGAVVDQNSARALGRDLVRALTEWISL